MPRSSQQAHPALAWVESPLQLLSAAEWAARRLADTGQPTRVVYRILDPQVVATAELLHRMGAPFARFEPYYGIPWTALGTARHWVLGDPLSGQARAATAVLPAPRRLSIVDDGAMVVHTVRAILGEVPFGRPGQRESRAKVLLGELAGEKLRRLASERRLELFTAFTAAHTPAERLGAAVEVNRFPWLRAAARRGGAPRIPLPADRIALGTARVVDGLLRPSAHLEWVRALARAAPLAYLPHRREPVELLDAVAAIPGVTVVRTGVPVELVLAAASDPLEVHTLRSSASVTLAAVLAGTGSVIRSGSPRTAAETQEADA
ncbi:hypothetical protein [Protaetiibacter mangrovi]|uniref:Uncharacterized protein n=1 Tax=Protaetiibacter mangrovi TaxID=2970926 RepID=A0ABT1ZIL8_9MICO|nr:hypothetical protein [Protaetiibacter mangrovi]MCS0500565.1 hypothetical protein [Protaetiibacter mangrovi]TPW94058.1 hypothetical protein FJ656_34715 [Schumannella luteola]